MKQPDLDLRARWRAARATNVAHFAISKRVLHTQPAPLARFAREALERYRAGKADDDVLVIDQHGITLAALAHDAVMHQQTAVIPGFDHRGRAGWVMLRADAPPFFTRARTLGRAMDELNACRQQRAAIHAALHNVGGLADAVRSASPWTWCKLATVLNCGWGAWQAEATLQRAMLLWLAKKLDGLPAFVLRRLGDVGRFAVAKTLADRIGTIMPIPAKSGRVARSAT